MHSAPSVAYPVGRCAFQRWVWGVLVTLTTSVLLVWVFSQGHSPVWYAALVAALWGAIGGWSAWHRTGTLTWDGQVWCLSGPVAGLDAADVTGEVDVAWDVQKALLLRWQPASDTLRAKPVWLWLDSQAASHRWQDVRRAVYQRSDLY